ncbi:MAG: trypsin-like peptidase domain-containing protein [Sphaerochaetaceae bacterium]|nr:trypsin-like peptidase domain-containing protein [Sphaerochaetaceae bacterium]
MKLPVKIPKKVLKIVLIVVAAIIVIAIAVALVMWTRSIENRKRRTDLRNAMIEVISEYGERGLLELAGVPVNDIFYSDNGLTIFQGDSQDWTYSADELQNISIFDRCSKAVVYISTSTAGVSSFLDVIPTSGVGSGFFISSDGYLITSLHVVEGATSILVTIYDGSQYDATMVGSDSENDICVLKISAEDGREFDYLTFGNSDNLKVGQKVLSIGNPFGYDRTLSSGIISGLSRTIRDENGSILLGMIQTDASINPGNSGGPLLDKNGYVIGVNSSIYSDTGVSQGLNFAVASNTAYASAQDLIKYGKVNRGWIDIVPVQLSQQIVDYAGLSVSKGLLVSQVVQGGKAASAGLKGGTKQVLYGESVIYLGGDVITAINGVPVSEYSDLFTAMSNTRPGDTAELKINRNGTEMTIKVELVERTSENVGWLNR